MSVNDPQRLKYLVVSVKDNVIVLKDAYGAEYKSDLRNLLDPSQVPEAGDIVSGVCVHYPAVTDLGFDERNSYDSVGPCPDAPSWEPRGIPDYSPGTGRGTPDSGDSRKRAAIESEFKQLSPARIPEGNFTYTPKEIVAECLKAWEKVKGELR